MDIAHLCNEVLTIKRISTRSTFGDAATRATTTVRARIERENGSIQGAGGEVLDYTARVFSKDEIRLTDLLYFPEDSAQNDSKRPTKVSFIKSLDGSSSHYEVLV